MTKTSDDSSYLWHDFMKGIHRRAVISIDEWDSWDDAGKQFYGEDTYMAIKNEYNEEMVSVFKR